jgi:hypothetical protein
MVQEVCFTDMFQSASPRHYPGPQGPTAAAMTSSYGYPGLYHAPTSQSHMPYPGASSCTDPYGYPVQPPDPQTQGGGGGSGSPTSWATTYVNNISPRSASTGLVDDWGSGGFMSSQGQLTHGQSYGGYRPPPPPPPSGLSGFDPMGLPGQYPSEGPSHSPLGSNPVTSMQHSSSPADLGNPITSSASGTAGRGHVRQPYDWMKKQPYPSMPASGEEDLHENRTRRSPFPSLHAT